MIFVEYAVIAIFGFIFGLVARDVIYGVGGLRDPIARIVVKSMRRDPHSWVSDGARWIQKATDINVYSMSLHRCEVDGEEVTMGGARRIHRALIKIKALRLHGKVANGRMQQASGILQDARELMSKSPKRRRLQKPPTPRKQMTIEEMPKDT